MGLYGRNTHRPPADPPTEAEVMGVFTDTETARYRHDRAVSLGDIATHIFWARGGKGNPNDSYNGDETPRITQARLKPLVETMVARGVLTPVSLTENFEARSMVQGFIRKGATYYGRTEVVQAKLDDANRRENQRDLAQQVADKISDLHADTLVSAGGTKQGYVSVILTRDQARRLFHLPVVAGGA